MDYVSLEDLREYLGVTDNTQDNILNRLVLSAVEFCEHYCDRKFARADYTDIFSGNNLNYHMCKQWPVISVASADCEGLSVAVKAVDGRKAYVNRVFNRGSMNCTMSYTAGYEVLPSDLQQAIIELASHYYKQKENINLASKNQGTETTTFIVKAVPDFIIAKLKPFRRVL